MTVAVPDMSDEQAPAAKRAGGSSFYFAMRILARAQREAMFEVYSFCRAVDDIADSTAPSEWRLARLADWRTTIDALYSGGVPDDREGFALAIQRFALHKDDFLAVIEGMEMDAAENIHAPSLERLELYCDRVACAVGRLSVRIFGMEEGDGKLLAHHLGQALQLTNILRDIDEDAAIDRLSLPREALQAAGIDATTPDEVVANPALGGACAFLADRARGHFAQADAIMARSPRRAVRAPKIMQAVYRHMLEGMIARGWALPRERVRVKKRYLLWVALRHGFV
jgi:squalene synthase HpnD